MRNPFARSIFVVAFACSLVAFSPMAALAASGYSLFGDASLVAGNVSPTGVQLRSTGGGYGGIDFDVASGLTFADVVTLAADTKYTEASCGGGSPRFQVNVVQGGVTKNIFVYLGPSPSYTGCPANTWQSSGNLVAAGVTVDTGQVGGTFYDPIANAQAMYGSLTVTGIQLVVDGGWMFGTQTVIVDNVVINDTTYTFESAASCKNSGWQNFTTEPGPFKNQGDCVSYFATQGKNTATGE